MNSANQAENMGLNAHVQLVVAMCDNNHKGHFSDVLPYFGVI